MRENVLINALRETLTLAAPSAVSGPVGKAIFESETLGGIAMRAAVRAANEPGLDDDAIGYLLMMGTTVSGLAGRMASTLEKLTPDGDAVVFEVLRLLAGNAGGDKASRAEGLSRLGGLLMAMLSSDKAGLINESQRAAVGATGEVIDIFSKKRSFKKSLRKASKAIFEAASAPIAKSPVVELKKAKRLKAAKPFRGGKSKR